MSMMLHRGARYVGRPELALIDVPPATGRFFPVPHDFLADSVQNALEVCDYEITREQHALTPNGRKYFGMYNLRSSEADFAPMIGFRSSYDKSMAIRIALGSNVFICDNMALSGEIEAFRKHTTTVLYDLPGLLQKAFNNLGTNIEAQRLEFQDWREQPLAMEQIDHAVARIYRAGAIPATHVAALFDEFKTQTHDHGAPTLWRLYNAGTQVLKASGVLQLPMRSERLHKVIRDYNRQLREAA